MRNDNGEEDKGEADVKGGNLYRGGDGGARGGAQPAYHPHAPQHLRLSLIPPLRLFRTRAEIPPPIPSSHTKNTRRADLNLSHMTAQPKTGTSFPP